MTTFAQHRQHLSLHLRQRRALRLTQLGVCWTGILTLRETATASRQPEAAGQTSQGLRCQAARREACRVAW